MSCDNCQETIGNPDPFRIIYNWCTNIPVPRWVGEKAYKNCYHCGDSFKSGHQHHCRLCGEMYCSRCTGKYNIPPKYELKGKDGPTRVCYQCKNTCMQKRQTAEGVRPFRLSSSFTNPVWQTAPTYVSCEKCRKREKNPHNCRLCGFLNCDTCTSKLDIVLPLEYNKKNKPGPHRVCDECRYRYKAGALIRGINDPLSPESRYLDAVEARALSDSKSKSSSGLGDITDRLAGMSLDDASRSSTAMPHLNLNDDDDEIPGPPPRLSSLNAPATSASSTSTLGSQEASTTPVGDCIVISVRRAGKSTPIAVLQIPAEGSLEDVHNSLMLKCPELRSKNIQLIVRGEPVASSHWDIFRARHCRGEVLVSEVGVGPMRVMGPIPSRVSESGGKTAAAVPRPPLEPRPSHLADGSSILRAAPTAGIAKHKLDVSHVPSADGGMDSDEENTKKSVNVLNIDNGSTSAFAQAVFNSRQQH